MPEPHDLYLLTEIQICNPCTFTYLVFCCAFLCSFCVSPFSSTRSSTSLLATYTSDSDTFSSLSPPVLYFCSFPAWLYPDSNHISLSSSGASLETFRCV